MLTGLVGCKYADVVQAAEVSLISLIKGDPVLLLLPVVNDLVERCKRLTRAIIDDDFHPSTPQSSQPRNPSFTNNTMNIRSSQDHLFSSQPYPLVALNLCTVGSMDFACLQSLARCCHLLTQIFETYIRFVDGCSAAEVKNLVSADAARWRELRADVEVLFIFHWLRISTFFPYHRLSTPKAFLSDKKNLPRHLLLLLRLTSHPAIQTLEIFASKSSKSLDSTAPPPHLWHSVLWSLDQIPVSPPLQLFKENEFSDDCGNFPLVELKLGVGWQPWMELLMKQRWPMHASIFLSVWRQVAAPSFSIDSVAAVTLESKSFPQPLPDQKAFYI